VQAGAQGERDNIAEQSNTNCWYVLPSGIGPSENDRACHETRLPVSRYRQQLVCQRSTHHIDQL